MKKTVIIIICFTMCFVKALGQDTETYLGHGLEALANGKYEEAKVYLQKAAESGSGEACGWLALGYAFGSFTSYNDLESALLWGNKGAVYKDPTSIGVLGIINFKMAENKKDKIESLDLLCFAANNGFKNGLVRNLISTCLILKGERREAEQLLTQIVEEEKNEDDKEDYFMAKSLLAKLYLDEEEYFAAIITAKEAAEYGNPIALYAMGRSQIQQGIYPEIGEERVKKAVLYEYGMSDINAFEEEIKKYYHRIKSE